MRAIILAAGAGRRLGLDIPKSLIEIAGRSILHRQLAAFASVGVDDFVLVVGHARQRVEAHVADQPGRFTFVVNPRYGETNTVYSLYLARDHIDGDFYYANADVVFDPRLVRRLNDGAAASPGGGRAPAACLAVQAGRCGPEEVKVQVRGGRIVRIGKALEPADCLGEFVGVARFGAALSGAFVEALRTCVERENAVTDYFERAVDRLCDDWALSPVDVTDLPCIEIDFPEDLERARGRIAGALAS